MVIAKNSLVGNITKHNKADTFRFKKKSTMCTKAYKDRLA